MTIRVLIVDDHPIFRDGVAALLSTLSDMQIVAAVADGPEAIEVAAAGGVDVILMDLNLPTLPGIEATRQIAQLADAPEILVLTMVDDDDTVLAAMRAGARGYVLKGSTGAQLAAAVRTVAAGGAVFGAGVATQILASATAQPSARGADGLTQREREVLALLAEGCSNPQIARRLGLSLKTVQNYVSRILDKLHVADRTQAALRARGRR